MPDKKPTSNGRLDRINDRVFGGLSRSMSRGLNTLFNMSLTLRRLQFDIDHPGALSDLNMPLGNTTDWSTQAGSLVSVIQIEGSRLRTLSERHDDVVEDISRAIKSFADSGTTDFCWLHDHQDDREQSEADIRRALTPIRFVSETQGYTNQLFLDEVVDVLAPVVQRERTLLCIWTLPGEGTKKGAPVPYFKARGIQGTENLGRSMRIIDSHRAKVSSIKSVLTHSGFLARTLHNQDVGHIMANMLDPATNERFTPRLFGEVSVNEVGITDTRPKKALTLRAPANPRSGVKAIDYTCISPPAIGYQIWSSTPTYKDSYIVIGSRIYATILVTLTPERPVNFEALVLSLKTNHVPFRMAQFSKTGSLRLLQAKKTLAGLLRGTNINNGVLFDSASDMINRIKSKQTSVTLQIAMSTWAPKRDVDLLDQRVEYVIKALNGWGGCQAVLMKDDAMLGIASTLSPYSSKNVAPACIGPLEEVIHLAPLTRPTLPWQEGAIIFSAKSGKMMPFQPLSKELTHHVYLVCGEPGYGKSLLCQTIIIAIVESHEVLPYIAISDVGPGSLGTVRYLQNILPKSRKHQAVYLEMRNTKEMSINRFDTPLGLRYPLSDEMNSITSWVNLGVSDEDKSTLSSSIEDCIRDCIILAYDKCADSGPRAEPKRFEEADQEDKYWKREIGPALEALNITPDRDTLYWDLVEALFDAGKYREATLIQRFAVPLLSDVIEASSTSFIRTSHSQEISRSYTVADHVHKKLTSMRQSLEVAKLPTQIDIASARVTAFNLEAVVKKSDAPAVIRQSTLFYGLTSALQTDQFFWDASRVREVPEKYRAYHQAHYDSVARSRNLYFADEQHYFMGVKEAVAIPENIAFLGRKRGVGVMLSTQMSGFFTEEMRNLSTMRFYVGFSKSSVGVIKKDMHLDDWEVYCLENEIRKPDQNGANMLVQVEAASGYYSQMVNMRIGTRKLWSLSTQNHSSILRERVITEFGYEMGIEILSQLFSSGEVEGEYERMKQQLLDVNTDTGLLSLRESQNITDLLEYITERTIEQGKQMLPELQKKRQQKRAAERQSMLG